MHTYHGSCHCGSITFDFKADKITSGLRCNCSICKRKGALMSDFVLSPEDLHINGKEHLGCYEFDSNIAKHYFCTTCGIYPFHQTVRMPGHYRVNLGCVDEVDTFSLATEIFNGKDL